MEVIEIPKIFKDILHDGGYCGEVERFIVFEDLFKRAGFQLFFL